jgi:hypothetical protein
MYAITSKRGSMARGSSFGDNSSLSPTPVKPQTLIPRYVEVIPIIRRRGYGDNFSLHPISVTSQSYKPRPATRELPAVDYEAEFETRVVPRRKITKLASAYFYMDTIERIKGRSELILEVVRRFRRLCSWIIGLILGTGLTATFIKKQVVDYRFLFLSTFVLGLIISIAWLWEKDQRRESK